MLLVPTYLDRSPLHGIGLFAGAAIKAGTVVWRFHPRVDLCFSLAEWRALAAEVAPVSFAALRRYSYKEGGRIVLCLDNAQFMNHAAGGLANVVQLAGGEDCMAAGRDIAAGEELCCDYFQYSDTDDCHLRHLQAGSPAA